MKRKHIDLLHELRMTVTQVVLPLVQLAQETRLLNELKKVNKATDDTDRDQFQREIDAIVRAGNEQYRKKNHYN